MESCASCSPGYHTVKIAENVHICKENKCDCLNGYPTGGTRCSHWSENSYKPSTGCSSCNIGFHLEPSDETNDESPNQLACRKNICRCPHGTSSKTCHEHEATNCYICDQGYHLENGYCKINICKCGFGKNSMGKSCLKHGEIGCEGKEANYFLLDGINRAGRVFLS